MHFRIINFQISMTGFIASIFIGISLGLIGGGGSILTVPTLVYLFNISPLQATAYSLFIVGITSMIGSLSYFKKGLIHLKSSIIFGIPSIIAVFLTRSYLLPAIPLKIFSIGDFVATKDILLLLFFAVLMIAASYSMIKRKQVPISEIQFNYPLILFQGIFIGVITGLIGAGGGFLMIPALVNLLKLPMKTAVGTSLLLISLNSLTGFVFSVPYLSIQWDFLLSITFIAIVGILIGSFLSTKIKGEKLKPIFGWFVLVMGIYIILKETLLS